MKGRVKQLTTETSRSYPLANQEVPLQRSSFDCRDQVAYEAGWMASNAGYQQTMVVAHVPMTVGLKKAYQALRVHSKAPEQAEVANVHCMVSWIRGIHEVPVKPSGQTCHDVLTLSSTGATLELVIH